MIISKISARKALKEVLDESFGQFVRDIRETDEISQAELARRMLVSRQFINAIEHDKANVSIPMAMKIAQCFGYPHEAFVEVLLDDMLKKAGIEKLVSLMPKAA